MSQNDVKTLAGVSWQKKIDSQPVKKKALSSGYDYSEFHYNPSGTSLVKQQMPTQAPWNKLGEMAFMPTREKWIVADR